MKLLTDLMRMSSLLTRKWKSHVKWMIAYENLLDKIDLKMKYDTLLADFFGSTRAISSKQETKSMKNILLHLWLRLRSKSSQRKHGWVFFNYATT